MKRETERVQRTRAVVAKKPYFRPTLVVYGSITRLTQGTGGSRADGVSAQSRLGPL